MEQLQSMNRLDSLKSLELKDLGKTDWKNRKALQIAFI